ncbi:putative fibroblast growth factor receptor-like 1-like [Apostichopus japonicus]|uniref:Putative fibroblast growth factor receptor-like 1-like n=1 Tax=Stichopus japonicus TaxID=307972 RepID=A0A2G8KNH1_STIJA|nr:putative fibroblast growth factor receptor-like 1-like [Apostichopus japonicus]
MKLTSNYSLVLLHPAVSDTGTYICMQRGSVLEEYNVEIKVSPNAFYLEVNNMNVSDGDHIFLLGDENINASCHLVGARQSNNLTWQVKSETVIPSHYSFPTSNNEAFDIVSRIYFQPNTSNGTIACLLLSSDSTTEQNITVQFSTNETIHLSIVEPNGSIWTYMVTKVVTSVFGFFVITTLVCLACIKDTAEVKDLLNFRKTDNQLLVLRKHHNIVSIIGIAVDDIPFYVYLEYMENGTLRNFMLRNYQQKRDSESISDSQQRVSSEEQKLNLVRFSVDVVEGMSYLFVNKVLGFLARHVRVVLTIICSPKDQKGVSSQWSLHWIKVARRKLIVRKPWLRNPPETPFLTTIVLDYQSVRVPSVLNINYRMKCYFPDPTSTMKEKACFEAFGHKYWRDRDVI